jgi:hypothetical protein
MAGDEIDEFLMRHEIIRSIIDSVGFKGMCATPEAIRERVSISEEELRLHQTLFDIDGYSAEVSPNILCGRESIRVLEKRLTHALE